MNIILFRKKFSDYQDLLKKKKKLKDKFPNWIHDVSIEHNTIRTMTVDSYVKNCIEKQLSSQGLNKYFFYGK